MTSLAILAFAPTVPGALVYVALFGAGSGTLTILQAALMAERYGPANYGSIRGAQSFALMGARTLAPLGAGGIAALLGGYPAMLWVLVALTTLGAVAVLQVSE